MCLNNGHLNLYNCTPNLLFNIIGNFNSTVNYYCVNCYSEVHIKLMKRHDTLARVNDCHMQGLELIFIHFIKTSA